MSARLGNVPLHQQHPIHDGCEFDPVTGVAAFDDSPHNLATTAAWVVGHRPAWRLCEDCAASPRFQRFTRRARIAKRTS